MSFNILLLNAVVYICTFLYAFYKAKTLNLYVFIWLAYSIVTLMGYLCVSWDMYYVKGEVDLGERLSITPYVLSYFTTLLLTHPFKEYRKFTVNYQLFRSGFLFKLSVVLLFVFVFQTIVNTYRAFIVVNTVGLGEAYYMQHEGESIVVFESEILNRIVHITRVLSDSCISIYVIYFLSRITSRIGNLYINLAMMSVAFLPSIMSSLAAGSKGGLFFVSFGILFFYLIFRPYLNSKINRRFIVIGGIVAFIFISTVLSIVSERIELKMRYTDDSLEQSHLVRYLGESYPNLGVFYYGQVKQHPNGRRFFFFFFYTNAEATIYKYKGIDEKFDYWNGITGVRMANFKTFWGDWYVEFGTIGSCIAILIMYYIFRKLCFTSSNWTLSRLPLIYFFYIKIIIRGCFTGSGLEGTETHKAILVLVLLTFILRRVERKCLRI